jgi:hypothetical protein
MGAKILSFNLVFVVKRGKLGRNKIYFWKGCVKLQPVHAKRMNSNLSCKEKNTMFGLNSFIVLSVDLQNPI